MVRYVGQQHQKIAFFFVLPLILDKVNLGANLFVVFFFNIKSVCSPLLLRNNVFY